MTQENTAHTINGEGDNFEGPVKPDLHVVSDGDFELVTTEAIPELGLNSDELAQNPEAMLMADNAVLAHVRLQFRRFMEKNGINRFGGKAGRHFGDHYEAVMRQLMEGTSSKQSGPSKWRTSLFNFFKDNPVATKLAFASMAAASFVALLPKAAQAGFDNCGPMNLKDDDGNAFAKGGSLHIYGDSGVMSGVKSGDGNNGDVYKFSRSGDVWGNGQSVSGLDKAGVFESSPTILGNYIFVVENDGINPVKIMKYGWNGVVITDTGIEIPFPSSKTPEAMDSAEGELVDEFEAPIDAIAYTGNSGLPYLADPEDTLNPLGVPVISPDGTVLSDMEGLTFGTDPETGDPICMFGLQCTSAPEDMTCPTGIKIFRAVWSDTDQAYVADEVYDLDLNQVLSNIDPSFSLDGTEITFAAKNSTSSGVPYMPWKCDITTPTTTTTTTTSTTTTITTTSTTTTVTFPTSSTTTQPTVTTTTTTTSTTIDSTTNPPTTTTTTNVSTTSSTTTTTDKPDDDDDDTDDDIDDDSVPPDDDTGDDDGADDDATDDDDDKDSGGGGGSGGKCG